MRVTFDLPDLAEGLTEAEIVDWRVAVGDEVTLDQEIVEVSTAKAVVVIPSPHTGTVTELHGAVGDMMEVGAPLISFEVAGDEAPGQDTAEETRTPNLVGYGAVDDGAGTKRRRRHAVGGAAAPAPSPSPALPPTEPVSSRPLAKPPVRKLAKDLGVDLAAVTPTGPGGVVTRQDVLNVGGTDTAPDHPPASGEVEVIAVRGIRRTIAARMEAAGAIPAAAAWRQTRADGLLDLRDELADSRPEARITPFAIVLRLVVAALREVPILNAHYDGDTITRHGDIHLGVAGATDRGLLVPVIRDAHLAASWHLNDELRRLSRAARDGSIAPADLMGSTFSVTNYGALGMDGGVPLINAPEVGILGVGTVEKRPVVTRKGKVRVAPTPQVTLSFDHRVADGSEAAAFVTFVADRLADRGALLGSF